MTVGKWGTRSVSQGRDATVFAQSREHYMVEFLCHTLKVAERAAILPSQVDPGLDTEDQQV